MKKIVEREGAGNGPWWTEEDNIRSSALPWRRVNTRLTRSLYEACSVVIRCDSDASPGQETVGFWRL